MKPKQKKFKFFRRAGMIAILAGLVLGSFLPNQARAQIDLSECSELSIQLYEPQVEFSVDKTTVYADEPIKFTLRLSFSKPLTCDGRSFLAFLSIDQGLAGDPYTRVNVQEVPENGPGVEWTKTIALKDFDVGNVSFVLDSIKNQDFPGNFLAVNVYTDVDQDDGIRGFFGTDVLESRRIEIQVEKGSIVDNPDGHQVSPGNEGRKPFGEDGVGSTIADTLGGFLLSVVNGVIGFSLGIFRFVIWIFGTLVFVPLLEITMSMRADDISGSAILTGWTFVRDLVNMFYILFLIAIGFATILRIEAYDYRKLLANLIGMALLTNFSLLIGRIILQVMDSAQFTFLPANVTGDSLTNISGIRFVFDNLSGFHIGAILDGFRVGTLDSAGALAGTVTLMVQFIFELMTIITFGAAAAFMMVRTVTLWVLLIVSPVAYALAVLPATSSASKQWWSTFMKAALVGPILAFFFRLTIVFYQAGFRILPEGFASKFGAQTQSANLIDFFNQAKSQTVDFTIGDTLGLIVIYAATLGMLWAALLAASKFSAVGSSAIMSIATKGMKGGIGAGLAPAKFFGGWAKGYAGRKYNEATARLLDVGKGKQPSGLRKFAFAALNPIATYRGRALRNEERDKSAKDIATARGREVYEQFITGGWNPRGQPKKIIPYAQFVERAEENETLKLYSGMRKESLMKAAVDTETMGGHEGDVTRRAIVKAAAAQGYMDDLLRTSHFANKYADKDGTFYSAETLNRFMYDYLGKGEQSMRFMAEDMEDLGKQTGHYEYLGHAYFDTGQKRFERGFEVQGEEEFDRGGEKRTIEKLKNSWQADYAAGEFAKITGRERLRVAPHNFVTLRAGVDSSGNFTEVDPDGNTVAEFDNSVEFGRPDGGVDDFSYAMNSKVAPGDLREMHHSQARTKGWMLGEVVDYNTGELILPNEQQVNKVEANWDANTEYVRGHMGSFFGYDYRTSKEKVTGVKAVYYEHDPVKGRKVKRRAKEDIGHPDAMAMPVVEKVTRDVSEDKSSGIHNMHKESQAVVKKVIEDNVELAYEGRITQGDLQTKLDAVKGALVAADQGSFDPGNISQNTFDKIGHRMKEGFHPLHIMKGIDHKLRLQKKETLSPKEVSELSKSLSNAMEKAFGDARAAGEGIDYDRIVATMNGVVSGLEKKGLLKYDEKDKDGNLTGKEIFKLDKKDIEEFAVYAAPTEL